MSSRRPRVDCRQYLRDHCGIVVTQPIHATSTAQNSTVRIIRDLTILKDPTGFLSGLSSTGQNVERLLSARYRAALHSERPQPCCEGRASAADASGGFLRWRD